MPNVSDLEYLAGVTSEESAQSTAPTNVHVISGEVASEASSDGKVMVEMDGIVFGEADSQYIEIEAIGGLEEGDTVTILLTGEAGHGMSLMGLGSVGSVDRIVGRVSAIEADYVKVEVLEANYAHITNGVIDNATIGYADVDGLNANYAHISDGVIDNASIGYADVNGLNANYAHINNGVIDNATISYANVDNLSTNYAHISNGVIDNASIGYASVNGLSANYAQINGANITSLVNRQAWIDNLMVQTGLIAQEGTVYTLDAIQVNAANITAGTIDVERLVVTVDGEKYLVSFDDQGTAHREKLDGNIIEDLTITADKIVAGAITAEKITTQNIVGTGGWINLRNGTFAYVNANTGHGIVWNGTVLYISGNIEVGGEEISTSELAELAIETSETVGNLEESVDSLAVGSRNIFYNMPIKGWLKWTSGVVTFDRDKDYTCFIGKLEENTDYVFTDYHDQAQGCLKNSNFINAYLVIGDPSSEDWAVSSIDTEDIYYNDGGPYYKTSLKFNSGEFDHFVVCTTDYDAGFDETGRAKLELGTMPTDWTPAVEDVATSITDVRSETFSEIENVQSEVNSLSSDVSDVRDDLTNLRKDINTEIAKRDYWMTFRNADGLDIGAVGSSFRTNYTNTDINFMDGDTVLMNLNGLEGVTAPKVSSDEVHLGNWMLVRRANGNLSLKYVGPEL